ncbi:DNA methyltransferase [Brevundimonas sp.]|uniref:DNA methyltransferase n=1 Tax=Brevundimonas sp. TaxID=1871086 RepID=UPI002AB9E764|nr:DNA methyltransferase [Brevundimonas sp.]MDZ4362051.1 DNA methyltransferase [Brevundimonas sp.]
MTAVHPLHSICPYFAMFPPGFVERYVLAFTEPGDVVFDPFSGRGTTVFESLLLNRRAYGLDINPVAACVSGAKADPPTVAALLRRIAQLREQFSDMGVAQVPNTEFFEACFAPSTLKQIVFLRNSLNWTSSKVDRFIAAMALGCLHGESHKSLNCFSNRMPRTISTKPDYSVRWWAANGYEAPVRDVFDILAAQVKFRFARGVPSISGEARLGDVRNATAMFRKLQGAVQLVVTSPPYLDTTDYGEDQWLRLWFLGGAERPKGRIFADARHGTSQAYWAFLTAAWTGIAGLLAPNCTIVIRIGGMSFAPADLEEGVYTSLRNGLGCNSLEIVQPLNVSEIRNRQTNVFRPGTKGKRVEYDFVLRAA